MSTIVDALRKIEAQKQTRREEERERAESHVLDVARTETSQNSAEDVQKLLLRIRANFELEVRELRDDNSQLLVALEDALNSSAEQERRSIETLLKLRKLQQLAEKRQRALRRLALRYRELKRSLKDSYTSAMDMRSQGQQALLNNDLAAIDEQARDQSISPASPSRSVRSIATAQGITYYEELHGVLDHAVCLRLPLDTARAFCFLPLYESGSRLFVAVSAPENYRLLEAIERILDADIVPVAAEAGTILAAIQTLAG